MVLVDSSVWVEYLRGNACWQADRLDLLLGTELLATCGLVVAEVLQGIPGEREFERMRGVFDAMPFHSGGAFGTAVAAAKHFRRLRAAGVTVRKTVDVLIATVCIENRLELLHRDRDFDAMEKVLGLRVVAR